MENESRVLIDVDDKVSPPKATLLGIQHFVSMFGGTVLVPYLTGLPVSLTIMCSGIGTIIYLLVTHSKIPNYLGSSFVYIVPIAMVGATSGVSAALGGIVIAGLVYVAVALVVKVVGTGWIDRFLPSVVVAPVVMVIGLGLAANSVQMAFFNGDYGSGGDFLYSALAVSAIAVFATAISSCLRGLWSMFPVLIGIVAGYVAAVCFGLVDFQPVIDAAWVGLPTLIFPTFEFSAIMLIAPVALVAIIEHIGHLLVVGEVVGRNYNEMLPKSLIGDGLATSFSGLVGGSPATTYAQNIGVMSVTRVYASQVFWYAGAIAFVVGGFCPKLEALIYSIPPCVMGGVSFILFGLIATNGISMIISEKIDFNVARNQMIVSVIMIIGIGMECAGIVMPVGDYSIPGMAVAAIGGVIMHVILPKPKKPMETEKTE
ncbi:uracil-xanthine permease family protein [Raoultibacter massiliensis]|uniref:Solute carrier family 23 protein n=1 Tax=Raoultibacter massiliensis TaxID=1852371 RepID=A0ABV1JA74_9ACTN